MLAGLLKKSAMASLYKATRYLSQRLDYSFNVAYKAYKNGHITKRQAWPVFMKCLLNGNMTYSFHWKNGQVMAPTISGSGATLLVRTLNFTAAKKHVFVGDVVTLRNPLKPNNILALRVAATEGCEMISDNKTDDPFVLDKNHFWVLADNENVKPEEANDSRTFGPIHKECIVGRAIYCVRSASDHSIVQINHYCNNFMVTVNLACKWILPY